MSEQVTDYEQYLPDIDIKDGLKRVLNKEKIYFMLLGKFKPAEMVNDIVAKIEAGAGANEIRNAAHALKGSSANLSMPVISNAALLIEEAAKKGGTGAEHIQELRNASDALEAKIKTLLS